MHNGMSENRDVNIVFSGNVVQCTGSNDVYFNEIGKGGRPHNKHF